MSQTEQLTHEQAYEDYIIDADFHLHLPNKKLYPYIRDPSIRSTLERHGPPPSTAPVNNKYATWKQTSQSFDRQHGTAITSSEIREVCNELAIDVPIVQPGTNLKLYRHHYPTLINALTRAYNDYVLDRVIDVDDDIYATVMVPNWDIEFALEELERVGDEPGFVAAQNWLTTYSLWGDKAYDPIFDKLVDLDLNLILHIMGNTIDPSLYSASVRSTIEKLVGLQGFALMANVQNMVLTGVFDKYPELKVCFQEAGNLWIPYVAYRLDEVYLSRPRDVRLTERLYEMGQDKLDRLPSEYIFENTFTATQPVALPRIPRTEHIDGILKASRAQDTFMYTSDWPHPTLDPADWLYTIPCIDDEMRASILHENAEDMLRIPE